MMGTSLSKSTSTFLVLLMMLCCSCATEQPAGNIEPEPTAHKIEQPQTEPAADKEKPEIESPAETDRIVAKVGDYVITADELAQAALSEVLPHPMETEEGYGSKNKPVDVREVLMRMIADKIMIIKAREQNLLQDKEDIQAMLESYTEEATVDLLLNTYLQGKINVSESEIDNKMSSDPRLKNRAQAKAALEAEQTGKLINELYKDLYEQLDVQELRANISQAVQIYKRLLDDSRRFGGRNFVRIKQIQEDLTHKEKNLPLATFEGGNVTFKYWLYALTDMSPPSRPPGLDTDWGFTEFLDKIMKAPLFVAEAKRLGLDKNEDLMKQIREREDTYLLFEAQKLKTAGISRNPGDEQVLEYFNSHPARGTDVLKIKQFWCQDLETAWKARLELDNGSDFDSVAKEYAVDKKVHALDVYPGGEGMFFDDLWKGKTTEVVGPVRGFKDDNVKWRIVIILEKHEGEPIEYSDKLKKHIQNDIWFSEKNEILDNYRMELLSVFPYKIYHENIIDPLNPP